MIHANALRLAVCAAAAIAAPLDGSAAQAVRVFAPEADATFPEPFSNIAGLRERPDGTVIIADRIERHVSVLDFAAGTMRRIGREGEGPGEYVTPIGLHPLPDGATLLADLGAMRMTVIGPNGTMGKTMPMMRPDEGMLFVNPAGTDDAGRIYFSSAGVVTMRSGGGAASRPDSAPILRLDPRTGAIDTVGALSVPSAPARQGTQQLRVAGGGAVRLSGNILRPQPYAPRDGWGVSNEGEIAIARAGDYRLDWSRTGRPIRRGPAIAYDPVPIGRREKEAWAESRSRQTMTFGATGGQRYSMSPDVPDIDDVDFPEYMPPFRAEGVHVTPNGDVWVERSQRSRETRPLFDVFDAEGNRRAQVRLPAGRRVVGFGDAAVYAVVSDADDLQWLERYRLEAATGS